MEEFGPLFIVMGGVLAAIVLLYGVSLALAPSRSLLRQHPYLSGNLPQEHAVHRFHVRWYAVTLLFLAFDMEMVFMYPWTVVLADVGVKALAEGGVFLTVLTMGVLYAWREGGLRWV